MLNVETVAISHKSKISYWYIPWLNECANYILWTNALNSSTVKNKYSCSVINLNGQIPCVNKLELKVFPFCLYIKLFKLI